MPNFNLSDLIEELHFICIHVLTANQALEEGRLRDAFNSIKVIRENGYFSPTLAKYSKQKTSRSFEEMSIKEILELVKGGNNVH